MSMFLTHHCYRFLFRPYQFNFLFVIFENWLKHMQEMYKMEMQQNVKANRICYFYNKWCPLTWSKLLLFLNPKIGLCIQNLSLMGLGVEIHNRHVVGGARCCESNKSHRQMFVHCKRKLMELNANGKGTFYKCNTVLNKDLILEQGGCPWL